MVKKVDIKVYSAVALSMKTSKRDRNRDSTCSFCLARSVRYNGELNCFERVIYRLPCKPVSRLARRFLHVVSVQVGYSRLIEY